jgi:uncharacterized protein (DUF1330 family)
MPAYVVTETKVTDPVKYEQYRALSPEAVKAAGGKFIARGGQLEVLEGQWKPDRLVIVQFDSIDAARAFYNSAKYREARARRAGATEIFNMVVVDGIA